MVEGWWRVGSDSHIMITGHWWGGRGDLTRGHTFVTIWVAAGAGFVLTKLCKLGRGHF